MLNLHYITDASGNQIAVQIPMSDWLLFQKEYFISFHISIQQPQFPENNETVPSLFTFL
jgi:hypothetical protein